MAHFVSFVDGGCPGNGRPEAVEMFGSYKIFYENVENLIAHETFTITHKNKTTNNIAEAQSLHFLLKAIHGRQYLPNQIYMDSQLIVNQYKGIYRIKNHQLKEIFKAIEKYKHPEISISWISGDEMKGILGH